MFCSVSHYNTDSIITNASFVALGKLWRKIYYKSFRGTLTFLKAGISEVVRISRNAHNLGYHNRSYLKA
jgi:hypothetical protein